MPGDATADLIRALIDDLKGPEVDWDGWASMAIILEFPDGEFNEAHGYLYSPGGRISAVASDPSAVRAAVNAYADGDYQLGHMLPRKILVQFDRTTGRYDVTFEESDDARWKATPRNFREIREQLRPALG
ncbi:MAG TPA: hypothetical protein VF156_08515 [Agromyces sp.]